MILNIQVGKHFLTATLAQKSSVNALVEMLSEGPVTIKMNDYASMEKVGTLPVSLPDGRTFEITAPFFSDRSEKSDGL